MSENPSELTGNLIFSIAAAAVGSGFQHGYHTGVINVPAEFIKAWVEKQVEKASNTPPESAYVDLLWGIITSIMNFGGAIGGILTALVSVKLGPKGALMYNNILVLVASILMGAAETIGSYAVMIVGRLIIGVNCGLNAGLCPMLLSEISPVSLRGAAGSVYQLVITISILIAQILGLESILGNEHWSVLFIIGLPFALFQVITLLFCHESPKHLICVKSDNVKAEKALKFLRHSDNVATELAQIKAEEEEGSVKVSLGEMLKTRHYRKPLIIAAIIMIAQQFSGINAVIFYSTSTFMSAGLDDTTAQYATIGIGVVNVLMTIVSVCLVEIYGRKTLLLIGFGGMAIVTLMLSMALQFAKAHDAIPWLCIVLIYVYIILFAAGAGSIPWFLVSEMFGQEARAKAVSVAVPVNWIANFIVTLTFPTIENLIGPFVFLIFVGLDVLFFLFIAKAVPETKNKTIEEIVNQWK